MNIQLSRPIVFLDLETTGLSLTQDRIVEIAMLKVSPDGSSWFDCFSVDKSNGRLTFSQATFANNISITGSSSNPLYIANSVSPYIELRDTVSPTRGFLQSQDGIVNFGSITNHPFRILTNNSERVRVLASGEVGIGKAAPSTTLDVEGPVRVKSYTVAGVPSASSSGSGSMIYVSNESGGAVMAFSDGTNWRRVTDRAIIS